MTGRPIRAAPRRAVFAAPAMPMAVINLSLAVYLPQFYATRSGIGLAIITPNQPAPSCRDPSSGSSSDAP